MNLSPAETQALDELRAHLRAEFGERLCELAVFGSRARGEAHEFSDLDVLVVIDALTEREGKSIAHFCGDLLTRHDVLVSTFSVSSQRMRELRPANASSPARSIATECSLTDENRRQNLRDELDRAELSLRAADALLGMETS